ncbi:MAG: hypothetical protein AAFP26_07760 [Planctomycetota bacterium]
MRNACGTLGLVVASGALGLAAQGAAAQAFAIEVRAPEQVFAADRFVVEVWGLYDAGGADSALAGFTGDAIAVQGQEGVASVGGVAGGAPGDSGEGLAVYPGYVGFAETVQADGADVVGAQGGQLANLFGQLNPGIETGNEALLFSFEVETAAGFEGTISYTLENDTALASLVWFPDGELGATVSSDAAGVRVLDSATVVVIPAPGMVSGLASGSILSMIFTCRRRR